MARTRASSKKKAAKKSKKAPKTRSSTELSRVRRQLLVAERLRFEAVRSNAKAVTIDASWLSAGIAHEFNNILGAAEGHATWGLDSGTPADMREALEVVVIACRRAGQITRALQGIAHPDEASVRLFKLNEVLDELCRLWGPLCEQQGLKLEIPKVEASLYGRPEQVLQILVNLVKNAAEASKPGGRIRLDFETLAKGKHPRLRIRVRDQGQGIPAPFREAIFKPFFTSKGALGGAVADASANPTRTGGVGLGLFLSKWLAQQHGGDLVLESSGAEGTTFCLDLPL